MSSSVSGRARIAIVGAVFVAWAVFMLVLLAVIARDEANSLVGVLTADVFNAFLAFSDIALMIIGVGLLAAAFCSRSDLGKATRALRALHWILIAYGCLTYALMLWLGSRSPDGLRALIVVAMLMAVVLAVWIIVLSEARRLCERLLTT